MLLKLWNKCLALLKNKLHITVFIFSFVFLQSIYAHEPHLPHFQLHGFIAQGVIDVDGSNFVSDEQGLSFDLTEIGLNASYQLSSDVRVAGQAVYLNGGNRYNEGLRVDYLILEWALYNSENWQTKLYLGRIKNYHWLYSSTRDIPMARPSIVLPQTVYFDATRDFSVGGDGGAISTIYSHENIGELDFSASFGDSEISDSQTSTLMGNRSTGDLVHNGDFQASIYWQPYESKWRFGLALTHTDFTYKAGVNDYVVDSELGLDRYYFNVEY